MGIKDRLKRLVARVKRIPPPNLYDRIALSLLPPGNPRRARFLNNLADAISIRFDQAGRMEDLEMLIEYYKEVLGYRPPGHAKRAMSLNNLANAVSRRFDKTQDKREDLEMSIEYHQEALNLRPPGHPDRVMSLNNLANVISTRFDQTGRMDDLGMSIEYLREALDLHPPGHPDHALSLNNLANAISIRFDQMGRMEDLEMSIEYFREALALRPPGHPRRAMSLNNLASTISARFDQTGRMEDLEMSIEYYKEAHSLRHLDYAMSLNNLATTISRRFHQTGRMEDLETTISYYKEVLGLRPPGHPNRALSLNNLADMISIRFDQTGRMEDLETSIEYYKEALSLRPPGHPHRAISLNNLAGAISRRFNQTGRMEDLEMPIKYHREVLSLYPPGHPHHATSLNNLANAISIRFDQTDRTEDLEMSIGYYKEVHSLRSPGHPFHAASLNNLASVISKRFDKTGTMEDLEMSIEYLREALGTHPPGHPRHPASLYNLANAISRRFYRTGRMEDLEMLIGYHQEALSFRPHGHPDRAASLNDLASAIWTRFDSTDRVQDLQGAAKDLSNSDTTSLMLNTPIPAVIERELGTMHPQLGHHSFTKCTDDLSLAFTIIEEAASHHNTASIARFKYALTWISKARSYNHGSTIAAYAMALEILDQYLIIYPTIESQQSFLSSTVPKSLTADAASAAIDAGQLDTAVQLLERGRAILWSRMRGYRHPIDELRQTNAELADEFEDLCVQLERDALSSESNLSSSQREYEGGVHTRPVSFDVRLQRFRILSENRDMVIEKIRQIDGFQDFLQTVPFHTLQKAACGGPVIIVNASNYRSDAIIVQSLGEPILVALLNASLPRLDRLSSEFQGANGKSTIVIPILRTLWEIVVLPVVNQLAKLGVAENSRIWWSLTSELCTLPLHAAGPYRKGRMNLLDLYIPSSTSTLSALITASSGPVLKAMYPQLLVIGQSDDGYLPHVEDEICEIRQLGSFVDILSEEEASKDAVLSGLRQHSWVHFACHGCRDDQPFQSYFQLHNGERLTLLDLIQARLPDAELAFLSACHTAAANMGGTPNEFIHLAGALQFCGFRSVVGTLWRMADIDGLCLTADFYEYMFYENGSTRKFPDYRDAAAALNYGRKKMRERRVPLSRWINFVHIGA